MPAACVRARLWSREFRPELSVSSGNRPLTRCLARSAMAQPERSLQAEGHPPRRRSWRERAQVDTAWWRGSGYLVSRLIAM